MLTLFNIKARLEWMGLSDRSTVAMAPNSRHAAAGVENIGIYHPRSRSGRKHEQRMVRVSTLSEQCFKYNITHINYLLIDVEGVDAEVLVGSQSLLSSHSIDFLEFEYSAGWKNLLKPTLDMLLSNGYECFFISARGKVVPASGVFYCEHFEMSSWVNLFCSHFSEVKQSLINQWLQHENRIISTQNELLDLQSLYFKSKYANQEVSKFSTRDMTKNGYTFDSREALKGD
jgi:FkbM family methyltransferase